MKEDPREQEAINLKLSLARFAAHLDEFEARIKTLLPKTEPVVPQRDPNFVINVVLAMKGANSFRENSD